MQCTLRGERSEEGVHVLHVAGGLGLRTAPALKRELLAAASSGARWVVADLAAASLLDSTPLGVLLGVNKLLDRGGVPFSVVLDAELRRFVRRMGLDELLHVVPAELASGGAARRSHAVADVS